MSTIHTMNPHKINYKFEILLGKGTFGMVYLVRRKKDSKLFVIKEQCINAVNAHSLKMALGEVKCLRRMRHPNIIAYYGCWKEDEHSYILMEYATRGTLRDLLEKRKAPLEEKDALYLFSQVTLGVHHIHSKKILHRDLKPENIMLTGRRSDVVKIGDFGVSKNIHEESVTCHAGSFYYMAPEMLAKETYDLQCDVWSMGVVLYEMVTQRLPFPAENLQDIIRTVVSEEPEPLSKTTSVHVVSLISKMLRKNSVYRPKTSQLVLCPKLQSYIVRIYLNLGRAPNTADREPDKFGTQTFLNFFKPLPTII